MDTGKIYSIQSNACRYTHWLLSYRSRIITCSIRPWGTECPSYVYLYTNVYGSVYCFRLMFLLLFCTFIDAANSVIKLKREKKYSVLCFGYTLHSFPRKHRPPRTHRLPHTHQTIDTLTVNTFWCWISLVFDFVADLTYFSFAICFDFLLIVECNEGQQNNGRLWFVPCSHMRNALRTSVRTMLSPEI